MGQGTWRLTKVAQAIGLFGLAAVLWWGINASGMPVWLKAALDILLVSGALGGSAAMGPWTYEAWLSKTRTARAAAEELDV